MTETPTLGKTELDLIEQVFGPQSKLPAGTIGEVTQIAAAVANIRAFIEAARKNA